MPLESIYRGDVIVIQIEKQQREQMRKRLQYLSQRNSILEKKLDSSTNKPCDNPPNSGNLGHVS